VTALSARGLHKAYGRNPVLRGIDLEVAEGSFTAILGPSGSGKTTLLRVLAGFERAEGGRVRIGSAVVDDQKTFVPPDRRRIGYVPQEGALFPHLTVAGNVGFGVGDRRRRPSVVARMLEMVGLAELAGRYPHQLSGGQQQRVALARALATEPEVVLLDEPFSSLDAALRASVRADVAEVLRKASTTALLVTHDQDEALSLADSVAVLREGRIVQRGTPHELYATPVDAALANFLGDANLVEGFASGGVVTTALGALPLCAGAADSGPVVVLLRPEQLDVLDAGWTSGGGAPEGSGRGGPLAAPLGSSLEGSGAGAGGAGTGWAGSGTVGSASGAGTVGAGAVAVGAEAGAGGPEAGREGSVVECEYYGHDAVLRVRPLDDAGLPRQGLLVRVAGGRALAPGTPVMVRVSAPVMAWPRASSSN
jgi:iron(III) transport system ATP-binding protein